SVRRDESQRGDGGEHGIEGVPCGAVLREPSDDPGAEVLDRSPSTHGHEILGSERFCYADTPEVLQSGFDRDCVLVDLFGSRSRFSRNSALCASLSASARVPASTWIAVHPFAVVFSTVSGLNPVASIPPSRSRN